MTLKTGLITPAVARKGVADGALRAWVLPEFGMRAQMVRAQCIPA